MAQQPVTAKGYVGSMLGSPMPQLTPCAQNPGLVHGLRDDVLDALEGISLGVMLYGSRARGTADPGSDVDVLQLVPSNPGAYKRGQIAVTAYTPAAMHAMAQNGSLFVLHLIREGLVLDDPSGVLGRALRSYRQPRSYDPLWREIRNASMALAVEDEEFMQYHVGLGRLGLYLLRTSLYVDAISADIDTFDVEVAAKKLGKGHLVDVLRARRLDTLSPEDCLKVRGAVLEHFSVARGGETLSQLAVRFARDSHHAAALVVQVLSTTEQVDYVGLPLPPL